MSSKNQKTNRKREHNSKRSEINSGKKLAANFLQCKKCALTVLWKVSKAKISSTTKQRSERQEERGMIGWTAAKVKWIQDEEEEYKYA